MSRRSSIRLPGASVLLTGMCRLLSCLSGQSEGNHGATPSYYAAGSPDTAVDRLDGALSRNAVLPNRVLAAHGAGECDAIAPP